MFQNDNATKLSRPVVVVSLLLHAAAILLLCLVSFPGSPPRQGARSATLIVPSLRKPTRHMLRAAVKPPPGLRTEPKRFIAPPQPRPKLTIDSTPVPALALELVRVPMPDIAPAIQTVTFDSATVPRPPGVTVKAAGFVSAENVGADIRQRRLTAIGGFETTASEITAVRRGGMAHASGFAPESAPPAASSARPEARAVAFGDASVAAPSALSAHKAAGSATVAAEILDKPRPAYTAEARRLNIEGEVLLEVVFEASGETRVGRVLHGLGHGLDEAAMAATRQIRFRPALRDGVAIDSSAVVHITFQLAN